MTQQVKNGTKDSGYELKNFFSDLQNLKFKIFEVKDLFSLTLKITKNKLVANDVINT